MLLVLTAGNVAVKADNREEVRERNRLALAERFTAGKLENMLFSTTVDPHWFKSGEKFWYSYKTSEGTRWYIVDPAARKRSELFNHDKLAAELTEIMKDPFIAAQLPITNLEVDENGYTFTFEVRSSQDAKPKKLSKEDSLAGKKPKKVRGKEIFYFSLSFRWVSFCVFESYEK